MTKDDERGQAEAQKSQTITKVDISYPELAQAIIKDESKLYGDGIMRGQLIGGLFLVLGFITLLLGITGSIDFIYQSKDATSRLTNASPGAFFALLGAAIVLRYKPHTRSQTAIHPSGSTPVLQVQVDSPIPPVGLGAGAPQPRAENRREISHRLPPDFYHGGEK